MDLVKRSELPDLLKPFGMEYGDSAVETALRATGIKPTRYQGVAGGKGRFSEFDAMVAWDLAAVWDANERKFRDVQQPMDRFRKLYDEAASWPGAGSIPGFTNDREFGAQLLMLTSPLYGMEPRRIRQVAREHDEVLEFSVHGRQFMVNVLQAYNNVYGATIVESKIDPRESEPKSVNRQLREFAQRWLVEAGLWFDADAQREEH
jgi:hypothetical protein